MSKDTPIFQSRLSIDWYKLTMGLFTWRKHRNVNVKYAFINRTTSVRIGDFLDLGELREELDHIRGLAFSDEELAYLRHHDDLDGIFPKEYLDFLSGTPLPSPKISVEDGQLRVEVEGIWPIAMQWETFILAVVNELYFRTVIKQSGLSIAQIRAEGERRLREKINHFRKYPEMGIGTFGLRRGLALAWGDHTDEILCDALGNQIAGISNVRNAMTLGKKPVGTMAHEMQMVYSALYRGSDEELRQSPIICTKEWFEEMGPRWTVAIPDTFGSRSFLTDMPEELAALIINWKQDSGDPYRFADRLLIPYFKRHGIDPLSRNIVFCDSLNPVKCTDLYRHFHGRIGTFFGIGTNLSNDVGFPTISIVMKAIEAQGLPLVKLSDNLAKAVGDAQTIEHFKKVFEYDVTEYEECIS